VIDQQHQALFNDANQLLAAVLSRRPQDEVATLIDALISHVIQHFEDEEAIINATGFPGAAGHSAIHRTLVDKAAEVANRFPRRHPWRRRSVPVPRPRRGRPPHAGRGPGVLSVFAAGAE
jgi:hemerythrin-like metal-binding protein